VHLHGRQYPPTARSNLPVKGWPLKGTAADLNALLGGLVDPAVETLIMNFLVD